MTVALFCISMVQGRIMFVAAMVAMQTVLSLDHMIDQVLLGGEIMGFIDAAFPALPVHAGGTALDVTDVKLIPRLAKQVIEGGYAEPGLGNALIALLTMVFNQALFITLRLTPPLLLPCCPPRLEDALCLGISLPYAAYSGRVVLSWMGILPIDAATIDLESGANVVLHGGLGCLTIGIVSSMGHLLDYAHRAWRKLQADCIVEDWPTPGQGD